MRTKKLRIAALALLLGILVGDFGGISQIHAAEVSAPILGDDAWIGNNPTFGENQISYPVDVPPVNDIVYTKEMIAIHMQEHTKLVPIRRLERVFVCLRWMRYFMHTMDALFYA